LLAVVSHRGNDPDGLAAVVAALRNQQGADVDVVVADETDTLPGAARGEALAGAEGEVVLFLGTGAVPEPNLARVVLDILVGGKADVAAVAIRRSDTALGWIVPIGGPPLAGLLYPAFGAGIYAIRREALAELGGFSPDAIEDADHDLLNRAALAGLEIEVVPRPLAVCRAPDEWTEFRGQRRVGIPQDVYDGEALARIARPFRVAMPAALADLPSLAQTEARLVEARTRAETWQRYHDTVVASRAWRLTGPLRAATKAIRRRGLGR
jgi:hypothetical protein